MVFRDDVQCIEQSSPSHLPFLLLCGERSIFSWLFPSTKPRKAFASLNRSLDTHSALHKSLHTNTLQVIRLTCSTCMSFTPLLPNNSHFSKTSPPLPRSLARRSSSTAAHASSFMHSEQRTTGRTQRGRRALPLPQLHWGPAPVAVHAVSSVQRFCGVSPRLAGYLLSPF